MRDWHSRLKLTAGFTLIELLITIGVLTALLTIAVPSFKGMLRSNMVANQTNDFISAASLARTEAVRRGSGRVTLCISADGATCITTNNWDQGYIVFADDDGDATVDAGEDILRVWPPLTGGSTMVGTSSVDFIAYTRDGRATWTGGASEEVIKLCNEDKGFNLRMGIVGRVRSERISCP